MCFIHTIGWRGTARITFHLIDLYNRNLLTIRKTGISEFSVLRGAKTEGSKKERLYNFVVFGACNMITFMLMGKNRNKFSHKIASVSRDDLRLTSVKDGCTRAHAELVRIGDA
jgi:hypothetical protein